MKANRMWLFSDVLERNKRVFKVPVYQRNYDWTNIQCEKLFQDIMKAGENNHQHFTGTVVYIDDVNGGSGLNEVLIIDGQQRITTMYILLKALYDASKGVSARIEDEVQEVMFNRHCDEKYKVKYMMDIPARVRIGKGLRIEHIGNIVINPNVIIGENVTLLNGVLIGSQSRGAREGTPTIGNSVWIGTNAIVVGKINIGNNVLIAPGAFVNLMCQMIA